MGKQFCAGLAAVCGLMMLLSAALRAQEPMALQVLPAEHKVIQDARTGARLTFLTTHPGSDLNFYFHEHSWLADSSMILFTSARFGDSCLMGYLTATGELVRLRTPAGNLSSATAAIDRPSVYGLRSGEIVELALKIEISRDPVAVPSKVWGRERVLAKVPAGAVGALNPNSDGQKLAFGQMEKGKPAQILTVDTGSGEIRSVCTLPPGLDFAYHVQWSHTNPFLLSFAAMRPRLNVVDIRDGKILHPYLEWDQELVTHEHWWGEDQLVFCGGVHPKPTEDAHVKVVHIRTGQVRILGAGSWWAGATPEGISKWNHWHCSGSDDGRWVASDNWHGDITLFEGRTTRPRLLTQGHRTYGKGDHPHVGWDRRGEQVIFASHLLGDPNVCVATIPEAMQKENPTARR